MQGSVTTWLEIIGIIVPDNQQLVNIIGDLIGIISQKNKQE
jgi:hypothetical protein